MAFTMRDAQINLDSVWKSASKTSKKRETGEEVDEEETSEENED